MPDSPGEAAANPAPVIQRPLLVRLYAILAWTTGVTIVVLYICLISNDLFHSTALNPVAAVVGVLHGMGLYPLYLVLAIIVAYKYRLSIPHMALMAAAGFVPFLSPFLAVKTVKHVDKKIVELAERKAKLAALRQKQAGSAKSAGRKSEPNAQPSAESADASLSR